MMDKKPWLEPQFQCRQKTKENYNKKWIIQKIPIQENGTKKYITYWTNLHDIVT
jgi:hypothetical protein